MAQVSFRLLHKDNDTHVEFESGLLELVWSYIRLKINLPCNWLVEECEDGEMVQVCSAEYLVSNYKRAEDLPKTISDIM